jgi:hypothetical protein
MSPRRKSQLGAFCEKLHAATHQGVVRHLPLCRADPATVGEMMCPGLLLQLALAGLFLMRQLFEAVLAQGVVLLPGSGAGGT